MNVSKLKVTMKIVSHVIPISQQFLWGQNLTVGHRNLKLGRIYKTQRKLKIITKKIFTITF